MHDAALHVVGGEQLVASGAPITRTTTPTDFDGDGDDDLVRIDVGFDAMTFYPSNGVDGFGPTAAWSPVADVLPGEPWLAGRFDAQ